MDNPSGSLSSYKDLGHDAESGTDLACVEGVNKLVIGDATIYCCDCRDVLPFLNFDVVITDPPYGINYKYDKYEDTRANLVKLVGDVMPLVMREDVRVCVLPGITQVHIYPEPDWMMSIQWNTTGSFGKYGYTQWMPALLYGKDLKGFGNVNNGIMKTDAMSFSGGEGVGFRREGDDKDHPCPKPENIMRKLVARLTRPDDVVIDPFMGSGTTGVSALEHGRKFIGIEYSRKYFAIAKRRLERAQQQGKLF